MLNQLAVEIHTLPVDQCHSHLIRYLKGMLRHSFVSPRRKEGPPSIWDTHGIWGNVFCKSTCIFIGSLSSRIESMEFVNRRVASNAFTAEKSERPEQNQDLRCQSGPSAKDSVIFSGGDSSKELWGRPTTTAGFGSSFWQVPYASNLCLLEDKVQNRGMYLFTISYGSDAMDQGSGVGWFSGWIKIFVIYSWYFNAEFWSTWCEDCFGTEQIQS